MHYNTVVIGRSKNSKSEYIATLHLDRYAVALDDDSGERALASRSFQKRITDYQACKVFLLNEK